MKSMRSFLCRIESVDPKNGRACAVVDTNSFILDLNQAKRHAIVFVGKNFIPVFSKRFSRIEYPTVGSEIFCSGVDASAFVVQSWCPHQDWCKAVVKAKQIYEEKDSIFKYEDDQGPTHGDPSTLCEMLLAHTFEPKSTGKWFNLSLNGTYQKAESPPILIEWMSNVKQEFESTIEKDMSLLPEDTPGREFVEEWSPGLGTWYVPKT